uniref:AMP-binding enzyme C-terminal domain-containing protein n=1 Tax=Timema poppense TaxID=170557 RepID=A0A7R9CK56_TIMPO|nr:unnamed protein product [Timema poppensis]
MNNGKGTPLSCTSTETYSHYLQFSLLRASLLTPLLVLLFYQVVDLETGAPLGPNCCGELCFKGPLLMKGYLGDLQATSATMDYDGFLRTGDVGYYDQEGYFYIVERVKELIKYKSFQVPPAELEAILLTHPSVQDAAVIGIPDEMSGELPMAFIVKQPGATINSEMVTRFVAEHVSPQKRLHGGVEFIDAIPKTASGKILRRELRERYSRSNKAKL